VGGEFLQFSLYALRLLVVAYCHVYLVSRGWSRTISGN
jgi:hypothetical protein